MSSKSQIEVENKLISIVKQDEQDSICLTDMVRNEDGGDHIRNWMRNRNTVEFIGLWETLNNPNFKHVEFDTFRKQAGLNSFNLTPRKWIETTNAIGIISKSGRYGGTYAHKDLAFEFGSWISSVTSSFERSGNEDVILPIIPPHQHAFSDSVTHANKYHLHFYPHSAERCNRQNLSVMPTE